MKKLFPIFATMLVLATISCDTSKVDMSAEIEAVRARSDDFVGAEAALDVEGSLAFYAEDAIVQPDRAPQIRGRTAIAGLYRQFFESIKEFSAKGSHITVSRSGDLACEYGVYRTVLTGSEGDLLDVGKYLAVWKKIDGEWSVVMLTFSSDAPAPIPVTEQQRKEVAETPVLELDDDVAAIKAFLVKNESVLESEDLDGWIDQFTENAIFMRPDLGILEGKEAGRESVRSWLEQVEQQEYAISVDEIEVHGDWAFARWSFTSQVTPKSGGETIERDGKEIWILKRQHDGSWKCSHIIYNYDSPPPPPTSKDR